MTSTREFLQGLSYDQLIKAREIVNDLIDEKQRETKVPLWRVCDDAVVYGWFPETDYLKAANCLSETARDLVEKGYQNEELHLELYKVHESELSDYLGDGSG